MNCPRCNSVNENNSKFCFSCGYNLSSINTQENIVPTPVQTSETLVSNVSNNTISNSSNNNFNANNKFKNLLKNKKLLLSVAGVVIIAIIGMVVFNLFFKDNEESRKLNNMFNPKNLIKIKKDGKYGYIDTKGKIVLDANYASASDFVGDYAVVTVDNGGKITIYQLIDKKGNIKIESTSQIKYIADYNVWIADKSLYNDKIEKISSDEVAVDYESNGYFKWVNLYNKSAGIMSHTGKITYTYNFGIAESYFSFTSSEVDETLKDTYCRVNIGNDKYAIVNCNTGKVVYDFTEYYISVDDDNIFRISNHSDFSFVAKVYVQNDKVMYQADNSSISLKYYSSGKYVKITDSSKSYNDRYSYINTNTGEITKEAPKSDNNNVDVDINLDEWEILTNNKSFNCGTGYGLMKNDKILLACEWDKIDYLNVMLYKYLASDGKEYIYVKNDSKWYLMNLKNKKTVAEFNTSYIYDSSLSTFMYYTDSDTKTKKVYNLLTNKTLDIGNSSLSVYSNYITVKNTTDKTLKYYNVDLELIYTESL